MNTCRLIDTLQVHKYNTHDRVDQNKTFEALPSRVPTSGATRGQCTFHFRFGGIMNYNDTYYDLYIIMIINNNNKIMIINK